MPEIDLRVLVGRLSNRNYPLVINGEKKGVNWPPFFEIFLKIAKKFSGSSVMI